MLIDNGDGTYTTGPLDIALILHDVTNDRFHYALYCESPMPGPITPVAELSVVRLRSKGHHTPGTATIEEARRLLDEELLTTFKVPAANVSRNCLSWTGWNDGEGADVLVVPNWTAEAAPSLDEALGTYDPADTATTADAPND